MSVGRAKEVCLGILATFLGVVDFCITMFVLYLLYTITMKLSIIIKLLGG